MYQISIICLGIMKKMAANEIQSDVLRTIHRKNIYCNYDDIIIFFYNSHKSYSHMKEHFVGITMKLDV